ncbi:MAG: spore coat protein CotJB [Christensenellaceae bacterium]|nr:spore coat protein CotJB [Christensenellaceae bacterium]MBR3842885.1 spore coat protein CotJB [Christensenellaceae bacterium]
MVSKEELLQQIAECEFTLVDINLFLDTHPECERALSDYNCYAQQLAALKKMYEENYGPLHNFGNDTSEGSWKWVTQAWPWNEMEG